MKKNFFTGFLLLLPIAFTLLITFFLINLLTAPIQSSIESFLFSYHLIPSPIWLISEAQIAHLLGKIIALVLVLISITLIGFLGQLLAVNSLLKLGDAIIQKIPIINWLYKGLQEIIKVTFNDQKNAFSQVVLIPYPHANVYSLGLISQTQKKEETLSSLSVFIPCVPNPSFGYMISFHVNEIIFTDMPVETAFKSILSCGVTLPQDISLKKPSSSI